MHALPRVGSASIHSLYILVRSSHLAPSEATQQLALAVSSFSWTIAREQGAGKSMATATRTTSKQQAGGRTKSLISRTLDRCRSAGASPVAGCFSVYVGPERERFVVRAECANHPLLRRLLDDAEREYGYAAQGPIALPGCHVDAFHDVLWHMEHDAAVDDDSPATAASSPICGLRTSGGSFNKGRAAGYRMLSPRSSPQVGSRKRS